MDQFTSGHTHLRSALHEADTATAIRQPTSGETRDGRSNGFPTDRTRRTLAEEHPAVAVSLTQAGGNPPAQTLTVEHAGMMVETTQPTQLIDLTPACQQILEDAVVGDGLLLLFSLHTTCGLMVNEDEAGFHEDLASVLEDIAGRQRYWAHDDLDRRWQNLVEDERPNGHSHVRATFAAHPSLSLPVEAGALTLGQWQRVFLMELDGARTRQVSVQIWGTSPETRA